MTLCDHEIIRRWTASQIKADWLPDLLPLIDPFRKENLQPASVDLTLADEFLTYPESEIMSYSNVIRLDQVKEKPVKMDRVNQKRLVVPPRGFALGRTEEWVNIPDDMVANVEGKSSLARLGIFVHITAGFIDPGFRGTITLEFFNGSPRYVELVAGIRICQIAFERMAHRAARPYGSIELGSKYQDQDKTTESRYEG